MPKPKKVIGVVLEDALEKAGQNERHPYVGSSAEELCNACGKPENDPDHYSEAECALIMLKMGFKIVDKKGKPATVKQLEAVIRKERQ